MNTQKNAWTFKVIVCGDGGTGKTTLIKRFSTGKFQEDTKMTIGADFVVQTVELPEDIIKLQLWDFAGEERFRYILPSYCLGAKGALLCYDITDYTTFENIQSWLSMIRENCGDIPIILVGNKYDLPNHEVTQEIGNEYIESSKCVGNILCSSKNGMNIKETFDFLAKWIVYYANNY